LIKQPVGPKRSGSITAFALIGLAVLVPLSSAQAGNFNSNIFSGYDSFIDRFTIVDEDTFDVINDFYLGFGAEILLRGQKSRFDLRNKFKYGKQSIDESLELLLSSRPTKNTGLDLRNSLVMKRFQPGSDYALSNNYTQFNSSLKLKRKFKERYTLALNGRFEALRYEEKTEFDYNYNYMDGGIQFEGNSSLARLFHIAAFFGHKEAPDTTELSYDRLLGVIESSLSLGELTLRFSSSADRKDYSSNVRSSYWYIISNLEMSVFEMKKTTYSLIFDSELTSYDTESEIYINTHFVRGGFKYKHEIGSLSSIYIEPRVARMFCDSSPEERYVEGSIVLGMDIFDSKWFWLTASYEPGYRDYTLKNNTIYSDFTINRISIIGSIHLPEKFSIDIFLTHEPEKHSRREDDFSVSLISVELKKTF